MKTVLIVGGYGIVGSHLSDFLGQGGDIHVIVAGRSLDKAEAAVAGKDYRSARRIDLADASTWPSALDSVDLVVGCIDQTETAFVSHVIAAGIAYVDITASDRFFQAIEALLQPVTAPVLMSVGLAPGLSNLLAAATARDLDVVESIDIGILMGQGDVHGDAAVDWMMQEAFDPAAPVNAAKVDFGPEFGTRTAHFMHFADQHTLARTMPGVDVTTRVAFDSALSTGALFWMGRTFAGQSWAQSLAASFSKIKMGGSDSCVLSVTARGRRDGQPAVATGLFLSKREAEVTARVAAIATRAVLAGAVQPGIWHSHQVLDPSAVFAELRLAGDSAFTFAPPQPSLSAA